MGLVVIHHNTCLAHLIDNACNGALLFARDYTFTVRNAYIILMLEDVLNQQMTIPRSIHSNYASVLNVQLHIQN
jgi:hypothetical protein